MRAFRMDSLERGRGCSAIVRPIQQSAAVLKPLDRSALIQCDFDAAKDGRRTRNRDTRWSVADREVVLQTNCPRQTTRFVALPEPRGRVEFWLLPNRQKAAAGR